MATSSGSLTNVTIFRGRPSRYRQPIYDGRMAESRMVSTPGTILGPDPLPEIEQEMDFQTHKKVVECGMGHVGATERCAT